MHSIFLCVCCRLCAQENLLNNRALIMAMSPLSRLPSVVHNRYYVHLTSSWKFAKAKLLLSSKEKRTDRAIETAMELDRKEWFNDNRKCVTLMRIHLDWQKATRKYLMIVCRRKSIFVSFFFFIPCAFDCRLKVFLSRTMKWHFSLFSDVLFYLVFALELCHQIEEPVRCTATW